MICFYQGSFFIECCDENTILNSPLSGMWNWQEFLKSFRQSSFDFSLHLIVDEYSPETKLNIINIELWTEYHRIMSVNGYLYIERLN